MKNLRKVALSLTVAASAIAFSAFRNVEKTTATTARYYNKRVDHNASTNPTDFIYVDGTNNDCDQTHQNNALCNGPLTTQQFLAKHLRMPVRLQSFPVAVSRDNIIHNQLKAVRDIYCPRLLSNLY